MTTLKDVNTNKSLTQVLEKLTNSIKISLNCIKIGEIVSFDKTDQTCSVRILHIQDENYNIYMPNDFSLEYPTLEKVPVVIMGGGGTYISHPISAGDQCVLLFCDYMIDAWWVSGKKKTSIVPRKHDISDAIAIVGVNATPNSIQEYSDYLRLQYSPESNIIIGTQIDVNSDTINLNSKDITENGDNITLNAANIKLNGDTKNTGTLEVEQDVTAKANVSVTGDLTAATLNATTAASGSFLSADNKTVTVVNGIVTSIA